MINVLHLGLSYKCNMKCEHCFVHKRKDALSEEDYYEIIDTLYEHGLFVMYYTFGEPLLSDKFEKISMYAHRKGMVQILMTNGSLIDDEKIRVIKESHISKVCVSIDHADSHKHDTNRNYKGAFDKAVRALDLLKRNGIKTEMSVTVTDYNADCLKKIFELGVSLNVDYISYLKERSDGKNLRLQHEDKYFDFFRRIILTKDKKIIVLFHDYDLVPILNKMYDNGEMDDITYERYYEMNCCHSRYTVSIEPSGDLLRCNLTHNVIGNIKAKSLCELLKDEEVDNESISCCSTISK